MDPAPPPHASWGVLGGGENLAETMIADQGLEEEAFLSARLGRVFQAERTGVEAPAMVSGEMASVVGAGEGAARRGERPEGKGGGGGGGAEGVGPGRPQRHLALAQNKMGALGEFEQVKLSKLFQEFRHPFLLLLVQAGHLSPSRPGQQVPVRNEALSYLL